MNPLLKGISHVGQYAIFVARAARAITEIWAMRRDVFRHAVHIGFEALPVVMLASAFAGIVTTVQTGYQLEDSFLSDEAIGAVVVPTLMLEMCALIPALVMASRVGAAIAAQLGTMRVTEQIDALEAMGLDSVVYLVVPRVAAGTLMFPVLYVASAAVAIAGGALAVEMLGYTQMELFISGARQFFLPFDAVYGMTKSLTFGFLITSIACWKGFHAEGGADGVGRAATQAVVTACINILVADYVLAEIML